MHKPLGFSVYISSFDQQKAMLEPLTGSGSAIFTSFHIMEEVDQTYQVKAQQMCQWLADRQFQIIADVSPKTLELFNYSDMVSFAQAMHISALRLDYGFNQSEIEEIAKLFPLVFNASTLNGQTLPALENRLPLSAMHNFYPRPETGLDRNLFQTINQTLIKQDIDVIAFIPGDQQLRGPIGEGLPTLEHHRCLPPYVAFVDFIKNYRVTSVFVGDIMVSEQQLTLIQTFLEHDVIQIPVTFLEENHDLYQQVYTIRVDSPKGLMRLQESRGYASLGDKKRPNNCIERKRGCITMDNEKYQRYSGEIQIMREDHRQDQRVNVIGEIDKAYQPLLNCIKNGDRIKFVSL
ncbi:MupG family TIM beta-alpha barrel fold protein [Amphibacillus jilinensis]|uniref:MupG family TIM beta-alpha barrel fold protein n=1 Tax=Amphibacillus jilinensis TaxID=1216008 RepID=UPI0002D2A0DF|nr:MupG family TIM beta-alpha barrel fold protein [Amphibacillus jilinensis]